MHQGDAGSSPSCSKLALPRDEKELHGDRFPGRRLCINTFYLARERHGVLKQPADVPVAEPGHVAQLGGAVEDFHGEGVVGVSGFGAERQLSPGGQVRQFSRPVVIPEAGDGEVIHEDLARGRGGRRLCGSWREHRDWNQRRLRQEAQERPSRGDADFAIHSAILPKGE